MFCGKKPISARTEGADWMLSAIRASLKARSEGYSLGGDSEVMRLVDEIVKREGGDRAPD